MRTIHFKEIDSTNNYCKQYGGDEDIVVSADVQTAGRGTKGRSFISDRGGVYVSVMRHYDDMPSSDAFRIMINSCVAVCRTVKRFGAEPQIRWANDVLVKGKKICGTLIENVFSGEKIVRSVVGIGLNVNNKLPSELADIATSLNDELGKKVDTRAVREELVKNLQETYTVEEYRSYISWFGQEVTLKTEQGNICAVALDVEKDGRLVCRINGEMKKISSAEVSLRL